MSLEEGEERQDTLEEISNRSRDFCRWRKASRKALRRSTWMSPGQVKEGEVTFAFLPACPGSGRTLLCSQWLAHLRGGCTVAPYTVWTSPRGWPRMPRHHWLWWTCPVNRKDVVKPRVLTAHIQQKPISVYTPCSETRGCRIRTWEKKTAEQVTCSQQCTKGLR